MNGKLRAPAAQGSRTASSWATSTTSSKVNERYGHAFGDETLCTVADVLRESVREQDLVCRWGGDEFLVPLPETSRTGAVYAAEKLGATIERTTTTCHGQALHVTMTFGLASSADDRPPQPVIDAADTALYHGKRAGRNRVVPSIPATTREGSPRPL